MLGVKGEEEGMAWGGWGEGEKDGGEEGAIG